MSEFPNIDNDLQGMQFREPILADPTVKELAQSDFGFDYARREQRDALFGPVDRRWAIATEAARRAILGSSEIGAIAKDYIGKPLSEQTPNEFITELSAADPGVAKTMRISGEKFAAHLALPSVPDELMPHDIGISEKHYSKDEARRDLETTFKYSPDRYEDRVAAVKQGAETPGITDNEKTLVGQRYHYARDTKVLALLAEINQTTPDFHAEGDVMVTKLESGISIGIAKEVYESDKALLLDPNNWQQRRQIKDRVSEVLIGGKTYIMKEKKTNRHTDTTGKRTHADGSISGHEDGNSSREEFSVGRKLIEGGKKSQGGVELDWEEPIAYAEFPDGFQFSLFKKVENMTANVSTAGDTLQRAIMNSPDLYAEDNAKIKAAAKIILEERAVVIRERLPDYHPPTELEFWEYADIKSSAMIELAKVMIQEATLDAGFWNRDLDGFGFTIIPPAKEGEAHTLKVIGFDYEYYRKKADVQYAKDELERNKANGQFMKDRARMGGAPSIQQSAEYAIMQSYGWALPPLKN